MDKLNLSSRQVELALDLVGRLQDTHLMKKMEIDFERDVSRVQFEIQTDATRYPVSVEFWDNPMTGKPAANITVAGRPHHTRNLDSDDDYIASVVKPLENPKAYNLIVEGRSR